MLSRLSDILPWLSQAQTPWLAQTHPYSYQIALSRFLASFLAFLLRVSFLLPSSGTKTTVVPVVDGLPLGLVFTTIVWGVELVSVVLRVVVVEETRFSKRNVSLLLALFPAEVLLAVVFEGLAVPWTPEPALGCDELEFNGGVVSEAGGDELGIPPTPVGVLDPELLGLEDFSSIKYTVLRVPAVPRLRESVPVSNLLKKHLFLKLHPQLFLEYLYALTLGNYSDELALFHLFAMFANCFEYHHATDWCWVLRYLVFVVNSVAKLNFAATSWYPRPPSLVLLYCCLTHSLPILIRV